MQRRKLLAIVPTYPYPPCDGVSYPIAYHLEGLRQQWDIDMLQVSRDSQAADSETTGADKDHFLKSMFITSPPKTNSAVGGFRELFFGVPSFTTPVASLEQIKNVLLDGCYDAIYVSPTHLAPWAAAVAASMPKSPKLILCLNDAVTQKHRRHLDLARMGLTDFKSRVRHAVLGMRVATLPRIERRLLRPFDLILVQTPQDRDAIISDCGEQFEDTLLVVPNGADESLFSLPYNGAEQNKLLHLGAVTRDRGQLLLWFLRQVFQKVKREVPDLTIDLVGPVNESNRHLFEAIDGVHVRGFAAEIGDAFDGVTMSVVPLFMRGGLVNKVVDSMAAGVPCSGARVFNGMNHFENGVHGFDVRSADQWTRVLIDTLKNPQLLQKVSEAARTMVREDFQWSATQEKLCQRVDRLFLTPAAQLMRSIYWLLKRALIASHSSCVKKC